MKNLNSISEFIALKDRLLEDRPASQPVIVINAGTCGQASGANTIIRAVKRELLALDASDKIGLRITGCHGFCEMEPSLLLEPGRTFYPKVKPEDISLIIDALLDSQVIKELLYTDPDTGERIEKQDDIPFFKHQRRSLLGQSEKVDPIRIFNYIENGGYASLCKVLERNDSLWVINEVKTSGLRGRGGAGFPTGVKWELLAKQPGKDGKYLICNGDEGDPGAYMDRSLLEGNPHAVIEGMIIGAFATGANKGILYVRHEYPLAIKHIIIALRQAHSLGLLGENILGSGFSFDLKLIRGAGAFVCGEETALIHSIEGKMGEPTQRPPYPVQVGVHGKPSAINNVESWANIPLIIRDGAAEFARTGTEGSAGTKIFSLVGKIKNTGLVEVPMGITLREIAYTIGGGPSGHRKIKAIQTGGPSGGCIPSNMFNLPIDYDSLAKAGSIMGSGGMIVMDEGTCMVDLAKYFMNFLKDESCGKCFTCRKGTQRMFEILEDITEGRGTLEQLDLLEELALAVKDTTMCGLGQSAPNPVLSTLRYYKDEYIDHIVNKKCTAGVCSHLVGAPCQNACPVGTEAWRYIALLEKGDLEGAYMAIREPNPFPSICSRVCDHPCESKCRLGTTGEDPVAIRTLKRYITDNVDPAIFKPQRTAQVDEKSPKVAVIGAGPAGLTAAHQLSLMGYKATIFEAAPAPGGMLTSCIPEYRLPRDVIKKEIDALIDENITLRCGSVLGKDITIDGLFDDGFSAVFIAIGAHDSYNLALKNEDAEGVYPSMKFLKAYCQDAVSLAKGKVGIIGGGNSAIDAARVAVRQKGVEKVTLLYRRTRKEMPAYEEEIEAALEEGVELHTLVTPAKLIVKSKKLKGVTCIKNELGDVDEQGRRRPVPINGSEFDIPLDTLVVAIGEHPESECLTSMEIEIAGDGTTLIDPDTLATTRKGVFAGGDLATGPNSVIAAIAAGKTAAQSIDRYLKGQELWREPVVKLPDFFIEPAQVEELSEETVPRVCVPAVPAETRSRTFFEVEKVISRSMAEVECRRCLRCDLEFTRKETEDAEASVAGGPVND